MAEIAPVQHQRGAESFGMVILFRAAKKSLWEECDELYRLDHTLSFSFLGSLF